jgi:hypothetical protein
MTIDKGDTIRYYVLVSKMYARTSKITGTIKDNMFTRLCRLAWPGISSIVENMSKVNEHRLIIRACVRVRVYGGVRVWG